MKFYKNRSFQWVVAAILIIGAFLYTGLSAYDAGYDTKMTELEVERDWFKEELISHSPYVTISPLPEYDVSIEESMTDDERMMGLIERFIDGIDTANITIEFDNSGYSKGCISIYYDRPIDATYDFEPLLPETYTYEFEKE